MTASTWQHRLDHARSAQEVVEVARDFMASFDPLELAALPKACQPPGKLFQDDICAYAFDLVRAERAAPDVGDLINRLARFFSHAATRLAQVTVWHGAGPRGLDKESA